MSFETLPVSVGDTVIVPGFTQTEGIVDSIEVFDSPDVMCLITVKFSGPEIYHEFSFFEGQDTTKFFTKKEQ